MTIQLCFKPDWAMVGTVGGISNYLKAHNPDCKGLHFQGEGWYKSGDEDILLIIAEGDRWRLFIWRKRDPRPIFQQLLALENCYD